MIKLICDWCGKETEYCASVAKDYVDLLEIGEPNRCNSCIEAWNEMQLELKQRVAEFRQEVIIELKVKYLIPR